MRWHAGAVAVGLLLTGGCAEPYTRAQVDLTVQARQGVAALAEAHDAHRQRAEEVYRLRRGALDDAFDADAQAREALSAEWIVAARKAYGVGVDALHRQRAAAESADAAVEAHLMAIDALLERLEALQRVQLEWSIPMGGER